MFCPRCGDIIEQNEKYCNKCGNYLGNIISPNNVPIVQKNNKGSAIIGVGIGVALLIIISVIVIISANSKSEYYFHEKSYDKDEKVVDKGDVPSKKGKYTTVIIADRTYEDVSIKNANDAYDLIEEDSVSQKDNCPSEIRAIEEEIISKYNIAAVNLCEMDVAFAKEVSNVFNKIYKEFPNTDEYLTNLTLINASMSDGYIAAFQPTFPFATADTYDEYPMVIKTQVLLNTKYFLNPDRLSSSVQSASASGHFPKNATKYSPVAHEMGHYLSFVAMMKNYDMKSILMIDEDNEDLFYDIVYDFQSGDFSLLMIEEAYENYKEEVGTSLTIDQWRGTISDYALAKDNSGEYIYDETIAEGFHDVYLNGDDAADASKYVVEVLKDKLKG